jgi:hypothetical protein
MLLLEGLRHRAVLLELTDELCAMVPIMEHRLVPTLMDIVIRLLLDALPLIVMVWLTVDVVIGRRSPL